MKNRNGEKLERWLANDLHAEFDQFENEILNDSDLADEFYSAIELSAALEEAAAQDNSDKRPSLFIVPNRLAWATGLVAAVLAFVLLVPQFEKPDIDLSPNLRGAGDTGAAVGFLPKGDLTNFPRTFVWHPANPESGTRYRWELYDDQSRRRGVAVVSDTTLVRNFNQTPEDSLGSWLWLVVELKANGLEGPTSSAVPFTVKAKGDQ